MPLRPLKLTLSLPNSRILTRGTKNLKPRMKLRLKESKRMRTQKTPPNRRPIRLRLKPKPTKLRNRC